MTPQEALELLTQITGHVQATREVHGKVMEAIRVLQGLVTLDIQSKQAKVPAPELKAVEA